MAYNQEEEQEKHHRDNNKDSLMNIFNTDYSSYLFNSIYIFLIYTIIYYGYEYINILSKDSDKIVSFLVYFFSLIISQSAVNLSLANKVCHTIQYTRAVSITMLFWFFCYGLLYFGLYKFKHIFITSPIQTSYIIAVVAVSLVTGIGMAVLSYWYIINSECTTSLEDLQQEYIDYLNKLNDTTNVVSQRIYHDE